MLDIEKFYADICEIATHVYEETQRKSNGDCTGWCVKASEHIISHLTEKGYNPTLVEGWVLYDDPSGCSDRDYDEHTWVECEGYVIDVTGEQFNRYLDKPMPPIYFSKKKPRNWFYKEPTEENMYAILFLRDNHEYTFRTDNRIEAEEVYNELCKTCPYVELLHGTPGHFQVVAEYRNYGV